jgi:hypothetical protein
VLRLRRSDIMTILLGSVTEDINEDSSCTFVVYVCKDGFQSSHRPLPCQVPVLQCIKSAQTKNGR